VTERVFIDAFGRDDEALGLGFLWVIERAEAAGMAGVIAVHALDNARRLTPPLPQTLVKALVQDKRAELDRLTLELMTDRHEPSCGYPLGPTLAIWVNDRRLDRIEDLQPVAICAIPWRPENIVDWKANYGAVDLRSGQTVVAAEVSNPMVVAALKSLTAFVNLSTGLSHPSDRASAVSLFQILHDAAEAFEPSEVRAWAVNNGWSGEGARELEGIADGVIAGRRFRVERAGWSRDILDQWREDAAPDET
jgi:hypothetical protein